MNKKFTKLIAALALLVFMMPSLVGWGQTSNYTIEFKSVSGSSDGTSTVSSLNDIVSSGNEYITSISNASNVYQAKSGYGVKLGNSSNVGKFTMNLSNSGQVTATTIKVNACRFNGSKASKIKLTINGSTTNTVDLTSGSLEDYEWTLTSATSITSIAVESAAGTNGDKRIYLKSLMVTYSSGSTPTYTVTYNANDGSANPATFVDDNGGEGYENGVIVTVVENEGEGHPNFTKTGYSCLYWSDMQDVYDEDATWYDPTDDDENSFEITGDTVLYAVWDINKYHVALSSIDNVTLTATYGTNSTIAEGQNPEIDYNTEITLNAADLASGKVFVWDVYKTSEIATKVTVTDNKFNVPAFDVTISGSVVDTYTVTYDCNGGTSGCPSDVTGILSGTSITLAAAPTKPNYAFNGWSNGSQTYAANAEYTVNTNVNFTAQWEELNYSNTYTSGVTLSTEGGTSASACKVVISNVEYDGIKAGTKDYAGAWQVTVPANTNKLHLHLAAWNGESVTLSVTPTGYSSNISLTANTGISGSSTTYTWGSENNDKEPSSSNHYKVITFDGPLEEAVTLTFTASSGKRFVVWGVNTEASTDPYITAADVDIASNATSGSIAYSVHNIPNPAGTLAAAVITGDWLTLGTVGETVPFTCTANPNTVERTATVTLTYTYGNDETTTEVTVTQAPLVVTYTYSLATSIESGKHYIITSGTTGTVYAMGHDKGNNRYAKSVAFDANGKISQTSDVINTENNVFEFVINGPEMIKKNNQQVAVYTIYDVKNSKYLYAAGSNNNNYLKTQDFNNANGQWTIEIDNSGSATIKAQGTNTNNWMRFNNGNSKLFSCYSTGQEDIYLYMKDNDANYEFYKDIAKDTWYFIASPVGTAPVNMGDLTDLYFYDEADHYWRNKEVAANADGFDFDFGKGYLAAYHVEGNSANGITLTFEGTSVCTDNTQTVAVSYNDNEDTNPLAGWNLVGNPYPHAAYLNQSFYTVAYDTENSKWVVQASTAGTVAACTGAMVKVDSGVTSVLFSKNAPSAPSNGSVKITMGQQVMNRDGVSSTDIDNAIVSFNEGNDLPKFYFMEQNANLYIPQNDKEYAILSAEAQGELPLNFRANADGQYTLTVNPEGVEMNYLHLIDNMTGNDIDLLQTPSYSFNAKTTDYESRFRLVFASNGTSTSSATEETFAFFSNGNLVVNNEGEATLQVIDVMGRVLSSQTISGTAELNLNTTPGVYVLRLVNGNDVKTQKIVVK